MREPQESFNTEGASPGDNGGIRTVVTFAARGLRRHLSASISGRDSRVATLAQREQPGVPFVRKRIRHLRGRWTREEEETSNQRQCFH